MSGARTILVPTLAVAVFVGLRLFQLEADPPVEYPSGRPANELLVEGSAKANEARRYGLFGTFATKPSDNYHIWSVQSPVYVLPLSRFFRFVPPGRASLRVFCVMAAGLGLLALYGIARQHALPGAAAIAVGLSALSFHDIQLTRGGLLEPYLNAVLCAMFLCALLALRHLPWLALAQLGFVAALFTKQTALMALPLMLVTSGVAHLHAHRRGAPRWQQLALLASALVLCAFAIGYVRTPEYWKTVEWNAGHMLAGKEHFATLSPQLLQMSKLVKRCVNPKRWLEIWWYMAPLCPLALFQMCRVARSIAKRQVCEPVELLASGWLLSALAVLQLTPHVRPRFSEIVVPPTALLVASFLVRTHTQPSRRWARGVLWGAAVAVLIGTDLRWVGAAYASATYELDRAGASLGRDVNKRDVIVGSRAPVLAFDTEADLIYVKGPFNTTQDGFHGLGTTHLLVEDRDSTQRYLKTLAPELLRKKRRLQSVELRGDVYHLYQVSQRPAPTALQATK